jgi:hypothetical protein
VRYKEVKREREESGGEGGRGIQVRGIKGYM